MTHHFKKPTRAPMPVMECYLGNYAEATVLLANDAQVPEKAGPVNSPFNPVDICLLLHMHLFRWERFQGFSDQHLEVVSFKRKHFIMAPQNKCKFKAHSKKTFFNVSSFHVGSLFIPG